MLGIGHILYYVFQPSLAVCFGLKDRLRCCGKRCAANWAARAPGVAGYVMLESVETVV
jgi:hypothetical protein